MSNADQSLLVLIRHAKTLQAERGQRDFDRELAEAGHHQGTHMQAHLRTIGIPADSQVLCSPSMRTRQTLSACMPEHNPDNIEFVEEIYAAHTGDLLSLLDRRLAQQPGCLVAVGHNPSMDSIVRWLGQSSEKVLSGMATGCIASFRGTAPLVPENWKLLDCFKPGKKA